MKYFRLILVLALAALTNTCAPYDAKKVVGDPSAFGDASSAVNLLPSLDTKCGGVSCITK